MTEADFIELLKRQQKGLSLRAYAKRMGVSVAYLSDVYRGRRAPGPKLLGLNGFARRRTTTTELIRLRKRL